jgi:hypothetical protein
MKFAEDYYPKEILIKNPDGSITGFVNERHCSRCNTWYSDTVKCPKCGKINIVIS